MIDIFYFIDYLFRRPFLAIAFYIAVVAICAAIGYIEYLIYSRRG